MQPVRFRILALAGLLAFSTIPALAEPKEQLYFLDSTELALVKANLATRNVAFRQNLKRLHHAARAALSGGPFSITYYPAPVAGLNPHDYYSESSYWWPDPRDPKAPYFRRDGERNPDRFTAHKEELVRFCQTTLLLSAAAYLYDEDQFAQKAQELIRAWFLDPETRMNPHARFAQVIPNTPIKRGVGILDTRHLILIVESVALLELGGFWNTELDSGLKAWFITYLQWLLTSEYGIDEQQRGNNHSSWYAVQVAVYARFVGNSQAQQTNWQYVQKFLIENQIAQDGRQPRELERTRSLDYSLFNLEALSLLARLAEQDDLDLWHYQNKAGATLATALDYVMPYWEKPSDWRFKQITPVRRRPTLCLYYAARGLGRKEYEQLFVQLAPGSTTDDLLVYLTGLCAQVKRLPQ